MKSPRMNRRRKPMTAAAKAHADVMVAKCLISSAAGHTLPGHLTLEGMRREAIKHVSDDVCDDLLVLLAEALAMRMTLLTSKETAK